MKRVVVIGVILAVVIGVTVAGYQFLTPEPYSITQDPDVEVIPIRRDTILATINAAGRIEPEDEVQVDFDASSVVVEVSVERGQYVTAGTVLARLEADDLELAKRRAQAELAQAEAQLEKLYRPALAAEVTSARVAVESAQANLERVLAGPNEDEITAAAADLRRTDIALKQAQWAYDQVAYRGDVGAMPQASQLEQATIDHETALANYNLAVQGPTEADIAAARSQLAQPEASLAQLLEGPGEADVAAAQAAVDMARIGLEQAELNLAKTSLIAPIDGVVTEVNIKPGERPPAQAAVILTDMSAYHITVEVDEIDIGRIARGQNVVITLDAIPDKDFEGHVADISPGPIEGTSSGIVAYEVTIALDGEDPRLLPGMTSDATIETDRLENVVVVPNRAVSIDRTSGEPVAYVEKVDEQGNPIRVKVELGLRDEAVSQVLAGLDEGDQIIIRGLSSREQLERVFQGG